MNQDLGQQGKGMAWRGRGSCWVPLHPCLGLLHSHLGLSHLGSPALPAPPSPSQPGQAGICPQRTIPGVLSRKGGQSLPGSSGCSLSLRAPWHVLDHFPPGSFPCFSGQVFFQAQEEFSSMWK